MTPRAHSSRRLWSRRLRRCRSRWPIWILLALFATAEGAVAQGPKWELVGPDGGSVTALAVDRDQPQTVFAGGSEGSIFRSDDGGRRWRLLDATLQLFGRRVTALEMSGDGTIYSLHGTGLLWRSRDGGASWQDVGLRGPSPGGGVPGPLVTSTIGVPEAATGPIYAASRDGGIFRSDDGGATWSPLEGFPTLGSDGTPQAVLAIAVDPVSPDTLWAGTETQGVYRSDDRGDSWQAASAGLSGQTLRVRGLVAVPATSEELFAVTDGGVRRSTDGGASWQTSGSLPAPVQAVVVDPNDTATLWALAEHGRTFRSEDSGASWEWVAAAGREGRALAVSGAAVLIGTTQSLLRSPDADGPWVESIRGLRSRRVETVDANRSGPSLLAKRSAALPTIRSGDFGATWEPVSPVVGHLARTRSVPRIVTATRAANVVQSEDDGATWGELRPLPLALDVRGASGVWSRAADWLLASGFEVSLSGSVSSELWFSLDAGLNWTAIGPGPDTLIKVLALDPFSPFTMLASAPDSKTVLRTRSTGGSWEPVMTGLPADPAVVELLADPSIVGRYLAWVAGEGLFETRSHGDSWHRVGAGLPAAGRADLIFDPQTTLRAYLAIGGHGVFQSFDGGLTWRRLTGGIAPGRFVDPSISVGGGATRYLYAATISGVARYLLSGEPCEAAADTLCLAGGRFEAKVAWQDFSGGSGVGRAHPLSDDTGAFWFFNSQNLEMAVKVLDGRTLNGYWWVFYGSLSNVPFTLRVRDTASGEVREYVNPPLTFASQGDTRGFPALGLPGGGSAAVLPPDLPPDQELPTATPAAGAAGACGGTLSVLCLAEGRFRVEVEWRDFHGGSGTGRARSLTDDTGSFWFFHPDNLELLIKVLDGRPVNGHWWVFYGSLSNVGFTLRVTDTESGEVRTYENPPRTFASQGDTAAF